MQCSQQDVCKCVNSANLVTINMLSEGQRTRRRHQTGMIHNPGKKNNNPGKWKRQNLNVTDIQK